jgi:hypothetical protein
MKYKRHKYTGPVPEKLSFDGDIMTVLFKSGKKAVVDLHRFPRMMKATTEQRKNWEIIGPGVGIHWPDVDEDIAVSTMLELNGKRVEEPVISEK